MPVWRLALMRACACVCARLCMRAPSLLERVCVCVCVCVLVPHSLKERVCVCVLVPPSLPCR